MLRKSFTLVNVCFALFLLLAGQSISFASTINATVYVGTTVANPTLYIETAAKGDSNTDTNAWFYLTDGNWYFMSAWIDSFQVTQKNGITTVTSTIEGYVNDTQVALVTYTWTTFRSVTILKIKMTDYYSGRVIGGVDTTKVPYTAQTGYFKVQ